MWYWLFKYVLLGPGLWLLGRPTIEGAEHIPRRGPVILASNHLTVADSFFLVLAVRRKITFVAKKEYFAGRGLGGAVRRRFFIAVGQIPIDRRGADASTAALDAATRLVAAGGAWGIYPEGTRSPDGRLYKGRTGVMRVALATDAPVVPVVVRGTETVNPAGARIWRFGRVHITVCEPLDLSRFRALGGGREAVRAATDALMSTLAVRSGQEYVDTYALRPAAGAPRAGSRRGASNQRAGPVRVRSGRPGRRGRHRRGRAAG